MNKEDLINLWDEFYSRGKSQPYEGSDFANFMQWLKKNDTRTEANPHIYNQSLHVVGRRNACLTGRKWYERFVKELEKPRYNDTHKYLRQCPDCGSPYNFLEAARKAAGLDENGEVV